MPGEVAAVVGPSGCGKTTLLELICGLQRPTRAPSAAPPAALMPQRDLLLPWLGSLDNAALALRARGVGRDQARASGGPVAGALRPAGFERTRPAELSGGMRQRVSFLRTLLAGKPVLALDEPFAALDAITRARDAGLALPRARASEPRTVVLVTHDVEEAVVLADRVVVMSPRPGPRGRPRSRSRCRARASAPTPPWWSCASGRSRRWGCSDEARRCGRCRVLAAARAARHLGAVRRSQAAPTRSCCRRHTQSRSRSSTTARCCGATSWSTAEEILLGILVARSSRLALRDRDALLDHAAARRLPAARRLAGDADRRVRVRCSCFWLGFGLCPSCS